MGILDKILGDPNKKYIKKLQPIVDKINELEKHYSSLSDEQLIEKTQEFKERLKKGETLDDLLPEAFANVREAAKRTLKQRHYDVQLIAGIVLHRGIIAEMKTGEGKTLSATLPAYLNALVGKPVYIVTVNDYLARRDAVWMGQVYYKLGLKTASIQQQGKSYIYKPESDKERDSISEELAKVKVEDENLEEISRAEAYKADIIYGTNNEFGFDYLRDNMAQSLSEQVQKQRYFAIIDEVDSILIDEARTPLIISAPAQESQDMYYKFADIVRKLKEGEDYNIDEKMRAATLTDAGIEKVEKMLGVENLYAEGGIKMVHHLEQALRAHTLFKKDRDYVVKDGEIIIVDEFTGRLMYGRRYSEGLHQAIEAKEGVKVQQESLTMATITFQNYFRMYEKLSGMTGTAKTEEEEFAKIYGLSVIVIPTNKPVIRKDMPDRIYRTEKGKFKAVVDEIKKRHEIGQPVLVGTISIEKNEILSQMLTQAGIKHNLLNAKNHAREAEIIAQAGRLGAVTVATNMAGRGVDIILGGNPPDEEEAEAVKRLGGLHVIGTERHESRRIDNQLRGRAGRQGDPGSSQFFVSLEDDLMRIFGSDKIKTMMKTLKIPEDQPIQHKFISKSIEMAQKKLEGHNFDIRKHLVEYDDVMNKQREAIYKMRQEILENAESEDKEKQIKNRERIFDMIKDEIQDVVYFHTQDEDKRKWNLDEIYEVVDTIFPLPIEVRLTLEDIEKRTQKDTDARKALIDYLMEICEKNYNKVKEEVVSRFPDEGERAMQEIEKYVLLRSIDTLWVEHIEAMGYLRTGIGLRGYGQRDPLVEYKREARLMFEELNKNIRKQVVYSIVKIAEHTLSVNQQSEEGEVKMEFHGAAKTADQVKQNTSIALNQPNVSTTLPNLKENEQVAPVKTQKQKVGRNDPCPCGSGKKYKKCHGR